MTAKFTPGPWVAHPSGPMDGFNGWWLEAEGGKQIGVLDGYQSQAQRQANARLIAAAPELYEALVEIRDMLWSRPDISDRLRPLMGFAEEAINQKAAAALAKAEGTDA